MNPIFVTKDGIGIFVAVRAGAPRDEVVGEAGGRIRISVRAMPEKGKANRAVVSLLAGKLAVSEDDVRMVSGGASRRKTILVRGVDLDQVRRKLR